MNKFYFLFLIFIAAVYSCKKSQKEHPGSPSITLSINQQGQNAVFNGQLNNLSLSEVKQTGFLWSKNADPVFGGTNVFLYNNTSASLQFNFTALSGFAKDSIYYVKAFYVDNSNVYHYSQQASFNSNGTKQPVLAYLFKTYTWGDEAELKLDTLNINDLTSINIIINQTVSLHPTRISGSKIYFVVPNTITNGSSVLAVTIQGQQSNTIDLKLTQPQITAGGPTSLISGNTLTIQGQFFNPTLSQNIVTIGTTKLNVVSATPNQLVVNADNVPMSDAGALTIQTGTNLATSSANYSVYRFLQPKKPFPGEAREGSVAVVLNGNIYTGLGKGKATNGQLTDWWKYDPVGDVWTKVADYPQAAPAVGVFSINNKAYVGISVFNGYNYSDVFYSYNPATNTWSNVAPFPGAIAFGCASFNSPQYGYIIGGTQRMPNGFVKVNDVWRFDPAKNNWKQIGSFPGTPRELAMGFTLNNKGYIVGGDIQAPYSVITEAWSFNFANETWKQVASMPFIAGSIGQFAFSINNKGYVGGGNNNDTDGISSDVYEYDPIANSWTKKETIFDPIKYAAAAVSIGNKGYIICGWSTNYPYSEGSQSFFQFIP